MTLQYEQSIAGVFYVIRIWFIYPVSYTFYTIEVCVMTYSTTKWILCRQVFYHDTLAKMHSNLWLILK